MKIDNSKIFYQGEYADVTLTVPASTTYQPGTVLGRNKDDQLVAFSTDNTDSASSFTTTPLYILAQTVTNDDTNAADISMVRAFEYGIVNKNKLIFIKSDDKTDVTVLDELKKNGFKLENVQDISEDTCLTD